jgi:hemerythrin-like domain-containing protein
MAAGPQAPEKPDTRDMVVVHRVFRREFRQAADLILQAPAGDLRRAARIADHLELVIGLLHHHHRSEDEYLWPMLLERAGVRADLVHRMERQHEQMAGHLANVETLLARWRRTGAASVAGELSSTLRQLRNSLVEHLDEEEQQILPIAQECMTVAEWEKLGEIAAAKAPARQRFTVFGLLLEETSRAETEKFMMMLPAVARFAWQFGARHRYARYIDRVRGDAVL